MREAERQNRLMGINQTVYDKPNINLPDKDDIFKPYIK
jgi:hypothetical protein